MKVRHSDFAETEAGKRKQARQERDARRGRLGPGHASALTKELARVIRLAFEEGVTGSLWGMEGPLRAGVRADLCLQGWGWLTADLLARDLLDDALRVAGARLRPDWNEGQPEWTIEGGTLIERTRCIRCHAPLPEGHFKFCGKLCQSNHAHRLGRLKAASEDLAVMMAVRSI